MRFVVVVTSAACAAAAAALADAASTHQSVDAEFVWAGDPQLRPEIGPARRWLDAGARWFDLPAGLALAAVSPRLAGLTHALAVVAQGSPSEPALIVDSATVSLIGPVDVPTRAVGTLARSVPTEDGMTPSVVDLAVAGRNSVGVLSVVPADAGTIGRRLVAAGPDGAPGVLLDAALDGFDLVELAGEVIGWETAHQDPALVDYEFVNPDEPWRVVFGGLPRFRFSDRPELEIKAPFPPDEIRLPGGHTLDRTIRRLVADHLRDSMRGGDIDASDPWESPSSFLDWLATPAQPWEPMVGRYWYRLWIERPDLRAAYPDPAGNDLRTFRSWAERRPIWEPSEPALPVLTGSVPRWHRESDEADGVDLIGYFGAEVSLTNVTGRIRAALDAAGVAYRTVDFRRTASPRRDDVATDDTLAHDTAIVVANPDQTAALFAEHGDLLTGRRLFGFWHWDVEYVPPDVTEQMSRFDEVWTLTPFTQRALADAGSIPVRVLPLPVPKPVPSAATRGVLGLPAGRTLVLVTFDYLSIAERKNPVGAIEAFKRAFPAPIDGGPVLVVKTINAGHRWVEHERVRLAAARRPDIVLIDRMLTTGDQLALIAHADVLLSLHRSEGLGLHLAEAMWLGTPTIATRYSGNLSFMDDSNSLLVDADLVPVERAEGYFPAEAVWADPDLDQAAHHLRRLVTDADERDRLAAAARGTMQGQPSPIDTGRIIASWCGLDTPRSTARR